MENLKLKHSLEELKRAAPQQREEMENFSLENGNCVHETKVEQDLVDNVNENSHDQLASDTQPFSIKTE